MKFYLLVNLFLSAATISNGARTNGIIQNMIVYINGHDLSELEKSDFELLAEVVASPVVKTTKQNIVSENDIILNYGIKFPYYDAPVSINLSASYTIDDFRDLTRKKYLNMEVLPLNLLAVFLYDCDPFSDILMITNAEPENVKGTVECVLDIMKEKDIKVVITNLDELRNPRENVSALYNSPRLNNISEEYLKINNMTNEMRKEPFYITPLKRMISNDENKLAPINSSMTILNGLFHLPIPDVVAREVEQFLKNFDQKEFRYNGQAISIHNFSIMFSFDNDYVLKMKWPHKHTLDELTAVLSPHGGNEETRIGRNTTMNHIKNHPFCQSTNEDYCRKESAFSLKSLTKAITASFPGSIIYIVTDVNCSDVNLLQSVLELMKEKNITVAIKYYGNEADPDVYVRINKVALTCPIKVAANSGHCMN